ncbi:MAG TPA: HTTM domain-containing protein, partial [Sandaracinaceae bacterium]
FLYDLTIAGWLSWRRSRPFAYAAVCTFHFFTHVFFNIGIFPFVMTVAATVFFEPDWPRAVFRRIRARSLRGQTEPARTPAGWALGRAGAAVVAAWLAFQIAMPLRTHLYGGNVLWHEQGMRWSWRVMVREKNGYVRYRVRIDGDPRERIVSPWDYLDVHQHGEFATQPDLILQLAHRIAADLRAQGHRQVEVRADAWASLNGRPSARLIDPDVDLARVEDGLAPATWILPAPEGPPIRLRSRRELREALARRP